MDDLNLGEIIYAVALTIIMVINWWNNRQQVTKVKTEVESVRVDFELQISELKRDLDLCRESSQLFHFSFENSEAAIVFVDPWGQIEKVNLAAEFLTGYSRAELEGTPIEHLVPDRYVNQHRNWRMDYMQAPRSRPMAINRCTKLVQRSGREIDVYISLNPQPMKNGVMIMCSIRERKKEQDHG